MSQSREPGDQKPPVPQGAERDPLREHSIPPGWDALAVANHQDLRIAAEQGLLCASLVPFGVGLLMRWVSSVSLLIFCLRGLSVSDKGFGSLQPQEWRPLFLYFDCLQFEYDMPVDVEFGAFILLCVLCASWICGLVSDVNLRQGGNISVIVAPNVSSVPFSLLLGLPVRARHTCGRGASSWVFCPCFPPSLFTLLFGFGDFH